MNSSAKSGRRELLFCVLAAIYAFISLFVQYGSFKLICLLFCLAGAAVLLFRGKALKETLSLQSVFAAAYIIIVALSLHWAAAGKLYLNEVNKLLIGFFFYIAVHAFFRRSESSVRSAVSAVCTLCSVYALLSVDMASLKLTQPLMSLIPGFDSSLTAFESGTRLTGIFGNGNILAGVLSFGIFLSLYLLESASNRAQRSFAAVCAALCSYAFVMAFSMGAAGFFVLSAILYLIAAGEKRVSAFVRMVYVAVCALIFVFVSFRFYEAQGAVLALPLLCAVLCAALCVLAELFVYSRLSALLEKRRVLFRIVLICAVLLIAVFSAAALTLAGPYEFSAGDALRRSAYPEPGTYTLSADSTGDISVYVESQNSSETMMHTSTALYSGSVQDCVFTVPEGSRVVYFNFHSSDGGVLRSAALSDGTKLKLDYKLLPSFIANRMQGLLANENAIQRTIFFADGMKLFRRNPLLGSGLGSFESLCYGYQDFYYMTKYVHNHYIQVLLDNGLIGIAAYAAVLICTLILLIKNRRRSSSFRLFYPAAAACFAMICLHSVMEVVMSTAVYIVPAMILLALISLCWSKPVAAEETRWGFFAVLAVFAVLIAVNMFVGSAVRSNVGSATDFYSSLDTAIKLDAFDKADYKLSYVLNSTGTRYRGQAERYASQLADRPSNSVHVYLVNFHLQNGDYEQAVYAAEKGVMFNRANPDIWNNMFLLFSDYTGDSTVNAGVAELYDMMQQCNAELMMPIELEPDAQAAVDSVLSSQ